MDNEKMHNFMKKRYSSLFETKKLCDCSFLVEEEEVFSHKLILAVSSPVFEAMLYGPLATSEVIVIDDVSVKSFKQMLTFIYTDTVNILSLKNAWDLVYLAKKYLIEDLLDYCINYVKKHIEFSNILLNYEYAELFCEESIRKYCQNVVQTFPNLYFNSDYQMKASTIISLLQKNDFNASEEEIFKFIIKWATNECHNQNIESSKNHLRELLSKTGILSLIRILTIPLNSFQEENILPKVFNDDEIALIKSYKINKSNDNPNDLINLNFNLNTRPRNNLPLTQKMIFREILKTGNKYHANYQSQLSTKLKINKSLLINGFLLPTRRNPGKNSIGIYYEKMCITINDVAKNQIITTFDSNQNFEFGMVHIAKTPNLILFEENKFYEIIVSWTDEYLPWCNEYPLDYLGTHIVHQRNDFRFYDPFSTGFILGLCYCPIQYTDNF